MAQVLHSAGNLLRMAESAWPRTRLDVRHGLLGSGHLCQGFGHSLQRSCEVRNRYQRQEQSRDPVNVVVREQREEPQNTYDLQLHFAGPVRHVFGKGVKPEIQDPHHEDGSGEEDHHDV